MKKKKNLSRALSFTNVQQDITLIKKILQRELPPEHFGTRDIIRSFFGAAFLGITFVFSKHLVPVANSLDVANLFLIIFSTIVLLTLEIYYIGYQRVEDKHDRPFLQFWLKRITTFCIAGILTSLYLIVIYNIPAQDGTTSIFNLIIAMSMPCAIGASITDLIKKY